jgi:hypothetical protein
MLGAHDVHPDDARDEPVDIPGTGDLDRLLARRKRIRPPRRALQCFIHEKACNATLVAGESKR